MPSEKSVEPELTRPVASEPGQKSGERERAQSTAGGLGWNVTRPRGVDPGGATQI